MRKLCAHLIAGLSVQKFFPPEKVSEQEYERDGDGNRDGWEVIAECGHEVRNEHPGVRS